MSQAQRRVMVGRRLSAAFQECGHGRRLGRRAPRAWPADRSILIMRGAGAGALPRHLRSAARARSAMTRDDASLNNANGREPSNLLGGLRRHRRRPVAAGVRLRRARLRSRRPWSGACAPCWAAPDAHDVAAPLPGRWARVLFAAGLGILPAPMTLPAGTGGLIGIAVAASRRMSATSITRPGSASSLPLVLLLAGLPLAFLATGLRVTPIAALRWRTFPPAFALGSRRMLKHARTSRLAQARRSMTTTSTNRNSMDETDEDGYSPRRRARADRRHAPRRAPRKPRQARGSQQRARAGQAAAQAARAQSGLQRISTAGAGPPGRAGRRRTTPPRCPTMRWKKTRACWKRC